MIRKLYRIGFEKYDNLYNDVGKNIVVKFRWLSLSILNVNMLGRMSSLICLKKKFRELLRG